MADSTSAYSDLRLNYGLGGLKEEDAGHDPIALFDLWIRAAVASNLREPNAMTLATVASDGRPSARIVLLRRADQTGFTFFTSYDGRKARELGVNPNAALVFLWAELERQVRVEGVVERTSEAESREYFAQRPRGSQLGAWASPQSGVLPNREALEARLAKVESQFDGAPVPLPPHWGGFRLRPSAIEFWQGRPNRLHDRLLFTRISDNEWRRERLGP